jgi:hypothetical protein
MLASIRTEMAAFDAWHSVVDGNGGAPELGKYKAILGQLLVDLGPGSDKDGAAAAAPPPPAAPSAAPAAGGAAGSGGTDTSTDTLEKVLSPVGRLYLAELRGEKGSYAVLVENWLTSVKMPENQRKAFRAPLRRLAELGRTDLERVIWKVWNADMLPAIEHVAVRFPFSRTAKEEATPTDIKDLFDPKDGKIFDLFRRYYEPISDINAKAAFHPKPAVARSVSLPPGLFPAINASAALSSRLWDSSGNPQPLQLKISTLRFDRTAKLRSDGDADHRQALTVMYLNVGEGSVFNFNQKPSLVTVGFDWTKDLRSQVGIQITDVVTKENSFPAPIVSDGQYWSFWHLLLRAAVSSVKSPPGAQLYTWEVWTQPDAQPGQMIPVRFVAVTDPWEPFAVIGRLAPRPKDPPKGKDPVRRPDPVEAL